MKNYLVSKELKIGIVNILFLKRIAMTRSFSPQISITASHCSATNFVSVNGFGRTNDDTFSMHQKSFPVKMIKSRVNVLRLFQCLSFYFAVKREVIIT